MKSTIFFFPIRYFQSRLHLLVVIACVGLALLGGMPESIAGWPLAARMPRGVVSLTGYQRYHCTECCGGKGRHPFWSYVRHSWRVPLLRSVLIGLLWHWSGNVGAVWLAGLPWARWGWELLGMYWPSMRRQAEWCAVGWLSREFERLVLVWVLSWPLREMIRMLLLGSGAFNWDLPAMQTPWVLGACLTCQGERPEVTVVADEAGGYTARLRGDFSLQVAGDDPFRKRLLILFLRLLEVPGQTRASRRTRTGRTPFVRQQDLAADFGIPQPDISRWEGYWQLGDWRRLLSLHTSEVLTLELQAQIVRVCAQFPWWGIEKVYQHLCAQGIAVSQRQVRQAAEESGWMLLRQELCQRYQLSPESFRPHDDWLVAQLLAQMQTLLEKLETGCSLKPQEQVEVGDLQTLCEEIDLAAATPALKALPWLLRIECVLFGSWELVTDEQVRCIYCGSTRVARKSRKPRLKKYYDEAGSLQTVEVFRYYCHNPDCEKTTFTNLPPGLLPYSPYRLETHLLAVQMYAWGYSTYRRTATALGVAPLTIYRWVSALGSELLPVAAIFGLVRCSGTIGVDEKFVLVPKNDKPAGKMRRWMYVYFAVDLFTYDLLHIAIYPHNNEASAQTFLLALRAKGYIPSVVVTDLRSDYAPLIARIFPNATHHECIFHALQNVYRHFKDLYGPDFPETNPQALALKQAIYAIFAARTQRTARKRYAAVLASRDACLAHSPEAAPIFDFLERPCQFSADN